METDKNKLDPKYIRAKKKVEDLKGYYGHLAVYIIVNSFISITRVLNELEDGRTLQEAVFEFSTFGVWFFWGIGLAVHTFRVFGSNLLMGKDWEARKIEELMKEK